MPVKALTLNALSSPEFIDLHPTWPFLGHVGRRQLFFDHAWFASLGSTAYTGLWGLCDAAHFDLDRNTARNNDAITARPRRVPNTPALGLLFRLVQLGSVEFGVDMDVDVDVDVAVTTALFVPKTVVVAVIMVAVIMVATADDIKPAAGVCTSETNVALAYVNPFPFAQHVVTFSAVPQQLVKSTHGETTAGSPTLTGKQVRVSVPLIAQDYRSFLGIVQSVHMDAQPEALLKVHMRGIGVVATGSFAIQTRLVRRAGVGAVWPVAGLRCDRDEKGESDYAVAETSINVFDDNFNGF